MLQGFGSRGFYKRAGFWDPSDKSFSGLFVQVLGTRDTGPGFRLQGRLYNGIFFGHFHLDPPELFMQSFPLDPEPQGVP